MSDEQRLFKIILNKHVELIDLEDDEISPLPLIYPKLNESFNFFEIMKSATDGELQKKNKPAIDKILAKGKENLTPEDYKEISDLSGGDFFDFIKGTVPKLVAYFSWTINKHYNINLNEDEKLALEQKILKHLSLILEKLYDFIGRMIPMEEATPEKKQ